MGLGWAGQDRVHVGGRRPARVSAGTAGICHMPAMSCHAVRCCACHAVRWWQAALTGPCVRPTPCKVPCAALRWHAMPRLGGRHTHPAHQWASGSHTQPKTHCPPPGRLSCSTPRARCTVDGWLLRIPNLTPPNCTACPLPGSLCWIPRACCTTTPPRRAAAGRRRRATRAACSPPPSSHMPRRAAGGVRVLGYTLVTCAIVAWPCLAPVGFGCVLLHCARRGAAACCCSCLCPTHRSVPCPLTLNAGPQPALRLPGGQPREGVPPAGGRLCLLCLLPYLKRCSAQQPRV